MNTKPLIWIALALGMIFVAACRSSHPSNQPWDRPMPENNNPGYNSPDPFPMDRGSKGTNSN